MAWLPFVTLGDLARHRRDGLVEALNELIDEQQLLIEAQQTEIRELRRLGLEERRLARDIAGLAVEALTCEATPVTVAHLAEMARELSYSIARIEEHSL